MNWCKDRQMDGQRHRLKSRSKLMHTQELLLDMCANRGNTMSSIDNAGKIDSHVKGMKLDPYLTPSTQRDSKGIKI